MYLSLSLTAFLLLGLTLAELWCRPSDWRGRFFNLQAFGLVLLVQWLALPLIQLNVPGLFNLHDWPLPIALFAYVIMMDLSEFLFHRAQHAIPVLWSMHSLHHSDDNMNATTAERHFWGEQIIKAFTIWPAVALIITPTQLIVVCYILISGWHIVAHSSLNFGFGRWSWVLNSPAYHRRHHSREPQHFNSNFSGLFPIFDLISGTYHRPSGYPETGLNERPERLSELALWPLRNRPSRLAGIPEKTRPSRARRLSR